MIISIFLVDKTRIFSGALNRSLMDTQRGEIDENKDVSGPTASSSELTETHDLKAGLGKRVSRRTILQTGA